MGNINIYEMAKAIENNKQKADLLDELGEVEKNETEDTITYSVNGIVVKTVDKVQEESEVKDIDE